MVNSLLGKPPKGYEAFSTFNPQQASLFQQLLGSMSGQQGNIGQNPLYQQGSSFLQQLLSGSPESTAAFEAPYLRQFNEQTVPGLAERFSGLGAGSQSSSAFQQALGGAGAGLQEQLASLRGQLQLGALPQALGYAQQPASNLQQLLGMNTQGFTPKKRSFWQDFLVSLGQGGAQGVGQGLGMLGTSLFL